MAIDPEILEVAANICQTMYPPDDLPTSVALVLGMCIGILVIYMGMELKR